MNKYLWELYLKSGGKEVIAFFEQQLSEHMTSEYADRIKDFHSVYSVDAAQVYDVYEQLQFVQREIEENRIVREEPLEVLMDIDSVTKEWMNILWKDFLDNNKQNEKNAFVSFISDMSYFSTIEVLECPAFFVPYYFVSNYNVLEIIAVTFDIELPHLPKKKDYKGRFYHYGEICKCLYKYRVKNGWSPYELFAFLYDFAPNYIGGVDSYIIRELPEPKSAFFIGGGGKNGDEKTEDDAEAITRWQCSPDTRAGDMIVMYLTSPISAISSVWRSCSVGFIDPFFYYYRCTYIGHPIKGNRIGLDIIKKDRILGKMPIVNKNMQGINGVELKPSEYNHILEITKAPALRMEYSVAIKENEYSTEKEVEDNVIKPFLKKLGYTEEEYTQQLRLNVGNHNSLLIPDFVLLPRQVGRNITAFAIVEAKRSITNGKELDHAMSQARSYAKQLGTRCAAVASQEKIWVTSVDSDYSKVLQEWRWSELEDQDNYMLIRNVLEKR